MRRSRSLPVWRAIRRGDPSKSHLTYSSLSEDKQIVVQKLASLLRIANALDHSHLQKVKALKVLNADKNEITLEVSTRDNFLLEKSDFNEKKELFERITGNKLKLSINENF